ncbi:MAG: radical SAM protein, partial [Candidatus Binatia bacterium]
MPGSPERGHKPILRPAQCRRFQPLHQYQPSAVVLTDAELHSVIDDARSLGCDSMQFIGGEPTLHPRLHALIKYAATSQYRFIEVFTNATRLTDDLYDAIARYGIKVAVS